MKNKITLKIKPKPKFPSIPRSTALVAKYIGKIKNKYFFISQFRKINQILINSPNPNKI